MKRTSLIALLLILSLLLAGCGKPEAGTVKLTPAPTEAPMTEAPATESPTTEVPATEAPETQTPETEAAENPLTLGRLEGGCYENAYAGFGCTLDESWTFYSAEELQELPDAVKEAVEGSEIGEAMEGIPQISDMMAENVQLLANMNVVYSKQDLTSRLAFQLLSDEEAVDAMLAQKDMMIEAYTQMGMTDIVMEKVQVTFLGQEQWAMKTSCKVQDVDLYQVQIFNYRAGSYGVVLTCGTYLEDNTQDILDLFYPVEK